MNIRFGALPSFIGGYPKQGSPGYLQTYQLVGSQRMSNGDTWAFGIPVTPFVVNASRAGTEFQPVGSLAQDYDAFKNVTDL